jgi:trehalose-6-phosphate synthase
MENTEYFYDIARGNWLPTNVSVEQAIEEIQEEIEKEVKRVVRRVDESTAARLFERFVKSLKN